MESPPSQCPAPGSVRRGPDLQWLERMVETALATVDFGQVRREYWDQNESLFLTRLLPPALVDGCLVPSAEQLKARVHRNFIPGHK